jgi:hypothetical protein
MEYYRLPPDRVVELGSQVEIWRLADAGGNGVPDSRHPGRCV